MKTIARTVALAVALAAGGAAATTHVAEACGGYVITEHERVQWSLTAFLGELGQRVSYGVAVVTGDKAKITIEMDTAAGGKRRAKARQTFFLEKREGAWKVVDWSLPTAAPAPAKVAKR
jgi:hypothetical protein